jgi:CO/xanthine dehydrogenase FAD-binding subunit
MRYLAPLRMEDALGSLSGGGAKILAGGTDFYPALRDRPVTFDTIDISRIAGLRGISRISEGWRIGATTTWTDLVKTDLPPAFDGLKAAAREIGAIQIQNAGTIVGNICNASPAADGVPPLLALDAVLELASRRGTRRLPLAAFLLGNRQTALARDEIATAVLVPKPAPDAWARFEKLGARAYLVISIVMVAAVIEASGGRIARARIAVGACSPVAQRLPALEAALRGLPLAQAAAAVSPAQLGGLAPIDDVCATAAYRRQAALVLLRRLLAAPPAARAA